MTITYDALLARTREGVVHEYDAERVMLYALGVGLGHDPLDLDQLEFVTERALIPLPTFVTVAVWDIEFKLGLGIEWSKLIHAAQSIRLLAPLPSQGQVRATSRFVAVYDKPGRGTLLVDRTEVHDASQQTLLAELETTSLARDFYVEGAPEGTPRASSPSRPATPPGTMDDPPGEILIETSPRAALIYRLLGGRSDIHWDPVTAKAEGFERPIMHGLCTYGHACQGLLRALGDNDPSRLQHFAARFSAPVFPGETLSLRHWRHGEDVHFEARTQERDIVVLTDGLARFRPPN